jgi:hypothetical protein
MHLSSIRFLPTVFLLYTSWSSQTTVENVLKVISKDGDFAGTTLLEVHIFIVMLYSNSFFFTSYIARDDTVVSQIRDNDSVVARRLQ